jgi:N4-(beta-N-acetylglucosaminyl)-L-asparaginase
MNDCEPVMNDSTETPLTTPFDRRALLGVLAGGAASLACGATRAEAATEVAAAPAVPAAPAVHMRRGRAALVGSNNALVGMQQHFSRLLDGAEPLDVAIDIVKIVEADPNDKSVGLGGLPDEDGHVTLDAACMHGPTHNAGSVACIQNILHPSEVARLVMERTDHVMLVGEGAYRFARSHGHPHVDLLTEETRQIWMAWKESMSDKDDRLPPRRKAEDDKKPAEKQPTDKKGAWMIDWHGERVAVTELFGAKRPTGTIHVSGISPSGDVACTTTTSGLAWKIPGRIGDSPIIGAGLYCDQEAGSAGGTGRGEAAILAHASSACIELMRAGQPPLEAGLEVLRRVVRQTQRMAAWQPELVDKDGRPTFDLQLYVLGLDGTYAGVSLSGRGQYAAADPDAGPRALPLVGVFA